MATQGGGGWRGRQLIYIVNILICQEQAEKYIEREEEEKKEEKI